jgi:hypothetical protein
VSVPGRGTAVALLLAGIAWPRAEVSAQSAAQAPRPAAALPSRSAPPGDVRQIVTFLLAPGGLERVQAIYTDSLRPIYASVPHIAQVRGYREVESPEPLDLVIVTRYASMAAMDSANRAMRALNTFALYGRISALAQHHHDQFVAVDPTVSDPPRSDGTASLTVFEYLRLAPGRTADFLAALRTRVRSEERTHPALVHSESGRLLVADGWDVLRMHTVESLGAWQRLLEARWASTAARGAESLVAARKVIIVREDARLRVR